MTSDLSSCLGALLKARHAMHRDGPWHAGRVAHHVCENCVFWRVEAHAKVYARINGNPVWVGQCESDDDAAPFAEIEQGLAVVFTQNDTSCAAFVMHPEAEEEREALRRHYSWLDCELLRDAWKKS